MLDAISAFIADVRCASESEAVASSTTDFIRAMRSGEKTVPTGFMIVLPHKHAPPGPDAILSPRIFVEQEICADAHRDRNVCCAAATNCQHGLLASKEAVVGAT